MMEEKNKNYCVVFAGGKGRRLWPCSRAKCPKQFIDFFGIGKTLLQQTYERMCKVVPPEHIFISTNEEYAPMVKEQLPDIKADHIMAEVVSRSTAPAVAWATHRISFFDPEASIVFTPSDQIIYDEDAFKEDIQEGLKFVHDQDTLLTMGIKPTRPEPGYGYIQVGDYSQKDCIYKVQSFTEKPDRDFATMFMKSGEWYWNTGLYLGTVGALSKSLNVVLNNVYQLFDNSLKVTTIAEEDIYAKEILPSCPNISIDLAILEKTEDVYVKDCKFGWADIGTWHGVYETSKKEKNNVVIDSDVMIENAHDNVIKLPKGKLGVINGLEGFIVAEQDNVLLICKKEDSSALIRKYVNEVQLRKGDEYI